MHVGSPTRLLNFGNHCILNPYSSPLDPFKGNPILILKAPKIGFTVSPRTLAQRRHGFMARDLPACSLASRCWVGQAPRTFRRRTENNTSEGSSGSSYLDI